MSPSVPREIRYLVRERAQNRCEYCRMAQAIQGATFHVEHIVPQRKGGKTVPENLALACPSCNFHKSDHTKSEDPETGQVVPLFRPRRDEWEEHFRFEGLKIVGVTSEGRATVRLLNFNSERRLLIRSIEQSLWE
ncbi:MAG: HNH endonuclease [bacterium]|nr:HNH endonuclease [bacterium]